MKKQILMAALCAGLTVFASCGGSSKQGTTDSSSVSQDTAGTNSGGNMPTDTAATPSGQSQGQGSGSGAAGDSTNQQKPVSSPGGTPQ